MAKNEKTEESDKILLPHHVRDQLCDTRLPYRRGRKRTAVKVYSIAKESNHLLIFGVPSLKLRQETKQLFITFGKLLQFNISPDHVAESFTETYHARFEKIHSARKAKKVLDTKNFFGGTLHVCYAPELESLEETHQKIMQRQLDVLYRIRQLEAEEQEGVKQVDVEKDGGKEKDTKTDSVEVNQTPNTDKSLLNMGEENFIRIGNRGRKIKRKFYNSLPVEKRFKPCFVKENTDKKVKDNDNDDKDKATSSKVTETGMDVAEVEVVDCTSTDKTTISNINEALNYNKFGEEVVFKVPKKPVNKIKFNVNKIL